MKDYPGFLVVDDKGEIIPKIHGERKQEVWDSEYDARLVSRIFEKVHVVPVVIIGSSKLRELRRLANKVEKNWESRVM